MAATPTETYHQAILDAMGISRYVYRAPSVGAPSTEAPSTDAPSTPVPLTTEPLRTDLQLCFAQHTLFVGDALSMTADTVTIPQPLSAADKRQLWALYCNASHGE